MLKAAALIIFKWIQFSGRVGATERSQQNKQLSYTQRKAIQCNRKCSYEINTLADWGIAMHPNNVLIKMSTVKTSRMTADSQSSLATLHSNTFEKHLSTASSWNKCWRLLYMAVSFYYYYFCWKRATITTMDLTQWKKFDSCHTNL